MGGLLVGIFGLLVLAAVPIGFALAIAAFVAIVVADIPLVIIPQQIVAGMDSFPMLAVPLFILAGFLMDVGGISRRLVTLARTLVGHLPGGLGQVVVMAEMFFSGVSGSTSADAAAIGGIMVPQLTANGYSRARATAIVSAACGMGILIPPAIVMVVYGVMGNVSIGALFVASIIPALLIAVGLMTQIGWQARRQGWPRGERASLAEVRRAAVDALLPLFMIVVILGGIRFGLFTPTEAAAVAVAYALLLAGPVYRSLTARELWSKIVQTAIVSGMVLFVVGAARLLGWVLAIMQAPQSLASSVVALGGGPVGFMVLTILIFLVLGAILEGVPAVVLLTPILLPLATQLGIDPVHFGAVIVATQGISVFLPPVGVSLLVACSVGGVEPADVARPLWPYLALMLALTVAIALVPGVVLWLPGLLGY
ncbi:MAG: TRAP transporter large permease [Gemmatimonadetes bacterium]|nr:TRAP transporter large permease [Gemmatimonadota bacterium]